MTPFIYVVAPTVLTFGLPPSHLGIVKQAPLCSRFVVGSLCSRFVVSWMLSGIMCTLSKEHQALNKAFKGLIRRRTRLFTYSLAFGVWNGFLIPSQSILVSQTSYWNNIYAIVSSVCQFANSCENHFE